MKEKELLKLAAKAINLELFEDDFYDGELCYYDSDTDCNLWWNPIIDDGDALRLAVELGLAVSICKDMPDGDFTVILGTEIKEMHNKDKYSATKLAIVRAAAEIGKSIK